MLLGINLRPSLLVSQEREDFPGGPVVKSLPASAGGTRCIPGLGRFHMPQGN